MVVQLKAPLFWQFCLYWENPADVSLLLSILYSAISLCVYLNCSLRQAHLTVVSSFFSQYFLGISRCICCFCVFFYHHIMFTSWYFLVFIIWFLQLAFTSTKSNSFITKTLCVMIIILKSAFKLKSSGFYPNLATADVTGYNNEKSSHTLSSAALCPACPCTSSCELFITSLCLFIRFGLLVTTQSARINKQNAGNTRKQHGTNKNSQVFFYKNHLFGKTFHLTSNRWIWKQREFPKL